MATAYIYFFADIQFPRINIMAPTLETLILIFFKLSLQPVLFKPFSKIIELKNDFYISN